MSDDAAPGDRRSRRPPGGRDEDERPAAEPPVAPPPGASVEPHLGLLGAQLAGRGQRLPARPEATGHDREHVGQEPRLRPTAPVEAPGTSNIWAVMVHR